MLCGLAELRIHHLMFPTAVISFSVSFIALISCKIELKRSHSADKISKTEAGALISLRSHSWIDDKEEICPICLEKIALSTNENRQNDAIHSGKRNLLRFLNSYNSYWQSRNRNQSDAVQPNDCVVTQCYIAITKLNYKLIN